jgi:predicted MFS family arabinose efflux permease
MPLFLALGAAGTAPFLGKRADQGYAARILWISGTLLAVSPLSYVILPTEEFLWAAPLEHALKGVAFSGFQISLMKLLLGETDRSDAPEALSIYFAATGIASGAAAVFGAWLASRPEWTSGIPGIIVVSAVGQVAVLGLWAIRKSSIGLRG